MRVGVVVVAHHRLGEEFLHAVRLIVPEPPPFRAVAIEPGQTVEEMRSAIAKALAEADQGDGVLVLTDMFGGTPSNLSLSFLSERRIEVVTGVNLPMLIKLATLPEQKPLEELAALVKSYGQRNISLASEILPRRLPVSTEVECEREFVVASELGLHARPAGRFVSTAGRFRAEVTVARDDEWVSGRSVLSLLSLAAARGTRLRVRAVGDDATEAVEALGQLLEDPGEVPRSD